MRTNQPNGVKTKMVEGKLSSDVKCKGRKIKRFEANGRKTRVGSNMLVV